MKFITLLAVIPFLAMAASPSEIKYKAPVDPVPIVQPVHSQKAEIIQAVISACEKYGADKTVALFIVQEEDREYDPTIQSLYPSKTGPNGREDSWGIAQIHLPDHPNITREQAQNITFSAEFLAQNLAAGNCYLWSTCPLNKNMVH